MPDPTLRVSRTLISPAVAQSAQAEDRGLLDLCQRDGNGVKGARSHLEPKRPERLFPAHSARQQTFRSPALPDKQSNTLANGFEFNVRHSSFPLCTPGAPIKATDLIGQHDTGWASCKWHLKRIPLDLRRHWTTNNHPSFFVVDRRAENNGRSVSSLLAARLRIKFQPYNITAIRHP